MGVGEVSELDQYRRHIRRLQDDEAGGPMRLCHTFEFAFRGEWKLPGGPGVSPKDLLQPPNGLLQ